MKEQMEKCLRTNWLGHPFCYEERIGSTNTAVKEMAAQGAKEGLVIAAGCQTAGKGRRGRSWVSPEGKNIYLSLLLRPDFEAELAPMLTIVTAYAAARAVKRTLSLPVQIKWPNDLVIDGRKVCGILTEMSVHKGAVSYVVVGIGMNVNMTEFAEEIKTTATSLALCAGREVDRAVLMAALLSELEEAYERYGREKSLVWMQEEYNSLLANCGREVRILDPAGAYEGTALGIDGEGRLLVRRTDGTVVQVSSGEVSVRGIYGYV